MEELISSVEQVVESWSFPKSISQAIMRVRLNLGNLWTKYVTLALFILCYRLLWKPESFIAFMGFSICFFIVYNCDEDDEKHRSSCRYNIATVSLLTLGVLLLFAGISSIICIDGVLVSISIASAIALVHAAFTASVVDRALDFLADRRSMNKRIKLPLAVFFLASFVFFQIYVHWVLLGLTGFDFFVLCF